MKIGKEGYLAQTNSNGEMTSFKHNGKEYLWDGNPAFWNGQAPTLFPNCGRVKDGKFIFGGKEYGGQTIHGFARRMQHSIKEAGVNHVVYNLTANDETLKVYPYQFRLSTCYAVSENGYAVRYTVANEGGKDMPFCLGSHPAYLLPGALTDCDLIVDGCKDAKYYACDDNGLYSEEFLLGQLKDGVLPLNFKLFEDNGVVFSSLGYGEKSFSVINRKTGIGFKVVFVDFPACVLWTPKADCPFICVEPWCGLPDDVNTDGWFVSKQHAYVLKEGEEVSFEYGFFPITSKNS